MEAHYDHDVSDRTASHGCESTSRSHERLRVGCALLPKKVARYLTPTMRTTAAACGIELVQIDPTQPLEAQGPFHGIIHKLPPNKAWERNLVQYLCSHPHVKVIDRLDGIRTLRNRATMLSPLADDGILLFPPSEGPAQHGTPGVACVQAPLQVEIREGTSEAQAHALLESAGLSPPLLCKPLWTDGREGSHGLAVLHDLEALGKLLRGGVSAEFTPPLVVQKFIEHGGVLYKVYVLGNQTVVLCRPSLADGYLEAECEDGVQTLPRISCASVYSRGTSESDAAAADAALAPQAEPVGRQQAPAPTGGGARPLTASRSQPSLADLAAWEPPPGKAASAPPEWVTHALAATLRQRLGMELFNFDLICPDDPGECAAASSPSGGGSSSGAGDGSSSGEGLLYMVIDINYFPGVDKIPDFEERFTRFLREVCGAAAAAATATTTAPAPQHLQQQQQHPVHAHQRPQPPDVPPLSGVPAAQQCGPPPPAHGPAGPGVEQHLGEGMGQVAAPALVAPLAGVH